MRLSGQQLIRKLNTNLVTKVTEKEVAALLDKIKDRLQSKFTGMYLGGDDYSAKIYEDLCRMDSNFLEASGEGAGLAPAERLPFFGI